IQQLSEDLNVAVSTLREVLRILEHRKIITIEQGRGMFVRTDLTATHALGPDLSAASLKDLFEARSLLEPELAFLAAQRGFMQEIEAIHQAAAEMSELVERRQDFLDSDVKFHHLIARAAHNEVLFGMFQSIEGQFRHGRSYTNMIPGMIEKAAHYHRMIASALKERNAEQAKSLMKSHVDDMMAYILSDLTHQSDGM
ncbi:MAG: FCD domain-containing protein, partial [Alicyclobacillus herbarius]